MLPISQMAPLIPIFKPPPHSSHLQCSPLHLPKCGHTPNAAQRDSEVM